MKKIVILIFVFAITLMSCSKDENQDQSPLIGSWKFTVTHTNIDYVEVITIILTFNENHTGVEDYTYKHNDNPAETDTYNFTWTESNNLLTLNIDGDTISAIYSISGNKLTFSMNGETSVFIRI